MREEGEDRVSRQANPHDCNDNGSTDVLARDASGALWRDDLFDWPSGSQITTAKRTKIGTGWQVYSQIEAAGNLVGTPAGDLVARDTAGVLWLYQGTGTGTFTSRVKIGTGWSGFTHLVGAGDATGDGRPDLIAYGPNGTSVYRLTGTTTAPLTRQTAPLTRQTTTLYAGEGSKFNTVAQKQAPRATRAAAPRRHTSCRTGRAGQGRGACLTRKRCVRT
ncbi:FG-GAP repeat domain-containing protein [Streptomyces purpureus]|uniref:VCBS repeat-containing protein n=1 Tax=Streptomyces purpureus TaxID=1951 RepID=A0A918LX53_9ACTN|nr:VCBS repeat-containing protein [Streptomyces purpureus]GGT62606.1 hypothetical protein GCM10014713_64960 [Streptomyces purpureus]